MFVTVPSSFSVGVRRLVMVSGPVRSMARGAGAGLGIWGSVFWLRLKLKRRWVEGFFGIWPVGVGVDPPRLESPDFSDLSSSLFGVFSASSSRSIIVRPFLAFLGTPGWLLFGEGMSTSSSWLRAGVSFGVRGA